MYIMNWTKLYLGNVNQVLHVAMVCSLFIEFQYDYAKVDMHVYVCNVCECLMIHFVGEPEYEYKLLVCHFEHYKCTIARKRHTQTQTHRHQSSEAYTYRMKYITTWKRQRRRWRWRRRKMRGRESNIQHVKTTNYLWHENRSVTAINKNPNCLALFIVCSQFNEPILMLNEHKHQP